MTFYYQGLFRSDSIEVSIDSLHLRYGVGFFETILYENQMICLLEEHLERLFKSFLDFQIQFETIDFESVFKKLLDYNGLSSQSARLNIFYPIHDFEHPAKPILTVRPLKKESPSLQLITYPVPASHFLSEYKSMNYMHCILAKRYAQQKGYDDAILLDSENNVIEASSSALLCFDGKSYISPNSKFALPSIALQKAQRHGKIHFEPIHLDRLGSFEHVYGLNSIRGVRSVKRINEQSFAEKPFPVENWDITH